MQVSKLSLEPKIAKNLYETLCQLISDIESTKEAKSILQELLSETERVAIMKRLGIAVLLNKGMSYEKIKTTLHVSSATIATIQEQMGKPGLQNALEKVTVNTLADAWVDKLSKLWPFFKNKKE